MGKIITDNLAYAKVVKAMGEWTWVGGMIVRMQS
jgi:hypothetical protein